MKELIRKNHDRRSGFTLIELSIVLVIIGLLVGGVLVGRDLIQAAQIRSLISDIQAINVAVNTFKGKYGCLPGDCVNATNFFGESGGVCNGFGDTASASGTCNGNGDGIIGNVDIMCTGDRRSCFGYEYYRFWEHLSKAGLIKGNYTGVAAPGIGDGVVVPGSNVPFAQGFTKACYSLTRAWYDPALYYPYFSGNYGLQLLVGYNDPNRGEACQLPVFTPLEAMNIDTKIDDGFPALGRVVTPTIAYYNNYGGLSLQCTNSWGGLATDLSTVQYGTSSSDTACMLIVRQLDP